MNTDDFRYMRRGKQLRSLTSDELSLLQPIQKKGKNHQRVLLALHGFSSSPAVYRKLLPQIKNYDAVICPVLPGHAESIHAFAQVKADDWLATAYSHCEQLIHEYEQVDVLGLSLGGLLACELSKHFKLHHLFLLAPALKLNMNTAVMLKLAIILKKLGFHSLRNAAGGLLCDEEGEIAYRRVPINAIIEVLQLSLNFEWVAPNCPVDLFLGTHDEVVSSKQVEQLFDPLSNVNIHWLPHSAHVLPLDNDREEIIKCINSTHSSI